MRNILSKVAAQPLVQFLVLGALLYGLWAWVRGPEEEGSKKIVVTATDVSRLEAAWIARWNRPPTREELLGVVREHVREIALYRHALAMGLDQNDQTLRRMLSRKLQTLTGNLLELSLSPTDEELRTFFEKNGERYLPPDLITFTQVFVDPDRRGEDTHPDALRILTELRSGGEPGEASRRLGDPFMLQSYYPAKTELEISKLFGQGFAQAAFALEPDTWHGPVLSGYGVHLVFVHHLESAPAPELAAVEERVRQDWVDERREELRTQYIDDILAQYEVVFEDGAGEAAPVEAAPGPSE